MDPKGVAYRECRDSAEHPNTLAIITALDHTGSMDQIPMDLVGGPGSPGKLSALMSTILTHGVQDPQVMFSAVGDHISDRAPLQVGQFEIETSLLDNSLTSIYIERGGGGGGHESYSLVWYFASRHTSIDCFEKRGKKGFLFTIGDEMTHPILEKERIQEIFGDGCQADLNSADLLAEAQRTYEVFHIQINHGYGSNHRLEEHWKDLLGERFLILDGHDAVCELIATTIAAFNGADVADVVKGFTPAIANSVTTALAKVTTDVQKPGEGLVQL